MEGGGTGDALRGKEQVVQPGCELWAVIGWEVTSRAGEVSEGSRRRDVAPLVECLPIMHAAPNKSGVVTHTTVLSLRRWVQKD